MLIGPGGVGKGTVAERLVARDPGLWLSRSWTTRPQRPGEADDAYVFVDRDAFEAHRAAGGFFESAEFLENLYGTPHPHGPSGSDVLLEIDVEGARQVLDRRPDATVILLVPPSLEEQEARMAGRGDDAEHVAARLQRGRAEVEGGQAMTPLVVVNDDLDQAVDDVAGIVARIRSERRAAQGAASQRPSEGVRMAQGRNNTLMDPPIEDLLDKVDSKFTLVALGSMRARQVNAYYNSLGEGLGRVVPPQVTSVSGKPLSIAFEEIAAGKATYTRPAPEEEAAELALLEAKEAEETAEAIAAGGAFGEQPAVVGDDDEGPAAG